MEVWPEGGVEGGRGILSVVFLRINVTTLSIHTESNRNKSPLASLAGYKPAVTQPLHMCLFITVFSQHALKSKESGHHVFNGLVNVQHYELLLTNISWKCKTQVCLYALWMFFLRKYACGCRGHLGTIAQPLSPGLQPSWLVIYNISDEGGTWFTLQQYRALVPAV